MNTKLLNILVIVCLLIVSCSIVFADQNDHLVSSTTSATGGGDSTTKTPVNTTQSSSSSASSSSDTPISKQQIDEYKIIFMILLIMSGAIVIVYIVVSVHIPFLPESVSIVTYGVLLGLAFRFTSSDLVTHVVTFDPENFFLFILPTIIFETGFSLPKTDFFGNIAGILLLAVLGTVITFLVVGGGMYLVGLAGWSYVLSAKDSFAFGAIISSTDPVCTLAIFQALNVDPTLYMLVLGESILNDAASIMLYRSVMTFSTDLIWYDIYSFFFIACGSVILGVFMALLLSLMLKWINFGKFPALENIFMIIFSYMSYVLSNALGISGVLAVFFCGITFNQYGAYSLSPYTKLTSRQLLRTAAFIGETAVFIYMGMSLSFHNFTFSVGLFFWSIFFTLLSRALSVFPICFALNKIIKNKISMPIQIAMWFAGLRGAFAFSLSLDYESPASKYIRTNTLLIVMFTIYIFGIGTYPLLKLLGIKTSSTDQSLDNISKPLNKTSKSKDRTQLYQSVDDKYFKKWFRKKVPPLATEAIEIFEKLVLQSSNDQELVSVPQGDREEYEDYNDDIRNDILPLINDDEI
ncbi:Na-H exchanger [Tieghemostelium lacteum]|uniref:Sodium/hydrogen exchanger n=1 Tax=Tieghemostelium lacteum TaxID=361077 RepID=A0A151ZI32_TIELA|nr:Na-H exchanger [Tieghemostelium lacteum]|eukprot:KYQ93658.1 Na-H exchanger [Tieghemostelium lacteum]